MPSTIPNVSTAPSRPLDGDEQLAREVELNSAEWLRLKAQLPWVQFHDDGDVLRLFAGDTWPANMVVLARFTSGTAHRRVREILAEHWKRKTACNWIVSAATEPADLGRHLRAHGFSCRIHCAGMACDLNALPPSPPQPDGITVELVDALPSLVPLTTERRRRRYEGRTFLAQLKPRKVWHFSAKAGTQPVGETILLDGANSAGIYDVEVIEKFRRRGIGSVLMDAALRHAKTLGHDAAVLGATGTGSQLYEKFGFREVCKFSFWKYGKMRQLRLPGAD